MSHPRIGRASEERVAQRSKSEVLDDNPIRGEVALTDAERAEREAEKQTLLQRLGVRSSAPAAEPTPTVVETAALSPEDATEVVGPLADQPTSAEIRDLIRQELVQSADAEVAAEAHKARLADLITQQAEAEAREARAIDAGVHERMTAAVRALRSGNSDA